MVFLVISSLHLVPKYIKMLCQFLFIPLLRLSNVLPGISLPR